jgi:hypothetical protein
MLSFRWLSVGQVHVLNGLLELLLMDRGAKCLLG